VITQDCSIDSVGQALFTEGTIGRGLTAVASGVALYECAIQGDLGEPAVALTDCVAFISGTACLGGQGLYGGTLLGTFCFDGGPGGAGLALVASTAHALDSTFSGGPGGVPGIPASGFPSCSFGPAGPSVSGSGLTVLPGGSHVLRLSAPVAEAQNLSLVVGGAAGEFAFAVISGQLQPLWLPTLNGLLLPAAPFTVLFLGVIPSSGQLAFAVPIQDLGSGVEAAFAHAQALCVHPSTLGPDFLSSPATLLLVDSALALDDCDGNNVFDSAELASGAADCDANGVLDACDLAAGTSPDCNGNGMPDACDVASGQAGDCNQNGVPDACDISAGTSQDQNGDSIPDECALKVVPTQYATLQQAVDAAQHGDTILLLPGIYAGLGNGYLSLAAGKQVTLRGQNAQTCVVDGLDLYGWDMSAPAGSPPTSAQWTVTDLTLRRLRGIYVQSSSPTFERCRFVENQQTGSQSTLFVTIGPALLPTHVRLRDCLFQHNNAYSNFEFSTGVEAYNESSVPLALTIERCSFLDNRRESNGNARGAALLAKGLTTVVVRDSLFARNACRSWASSSLYDSEGGAIFADLSARVELYGCTLVGNSANQGAHAALRGSAQILVRNSILWNPLDELGAATPSLQAVGPCLIDLAYTDLQGGTAGVFLGGGSPQLAVGLGLIALDPLFAASASGDYHPLAASPCIDAGDPLYVPVPGELDLDGLPRVIGPAIDLGAYEKP